MMRRDRSQALVVRNNKVLLVKHNMNGREFYCLPGGGIENGETPEMAAVRELKEESGVDGVVVRKLSVQYKPDNIGEIHTFLIEINNDSEAVKGIDPELPENEQTIIDVKWLSLSELGEVDRAYLWAAGLQRIEQFHSELLQLENKIYK